MNLGRPDPFSLFLANLSGALRSNLDDDGGRETCTEGSPAGKTTPSKRQATREQQRIGLTWTPVAEKPAVTITYCTACNFTARAAWIAQELLHTFHAQVAAVSLVPGSGGILEVALDGQVVFSRGETGRDPQIKELRDAIYPLLPGAPGRPHGL